MRFVPFDAMTISSSGDLFSITVVDLSSVRRLHQYTIEKLPNRVRFLAGYLMAHRILAVCDIQPGIFEDASCAAGVGHGDNVICAAVSDEDR